MTGTHQGAVAGRIVRDMRDGVLVIDLSGRIIEFNPAASRIMGIDPAELLQGTFAEHFLLRPNDEFNQAILDAVYESSVTHNRIVTFQVGEQQRTLSLTTSFLVDTEAGNGAPQRLGVIAVFNDITELKAARQAEERLAHELQDKHRELQDAYRQTEERNEQLRSALKKVQVIRVTATVFSIVLFLGVGLYAWSGSTTPVEMSPPAGAAQASTAAGTFIVTARAQGESLALSGKLQPLRLISVSAPFSGKLAELTVAYGQQVQAGQVLARMDDHEALIRHREAEAAAVKAAAAHRDLAAWEGGVEVARARRSVIRARMALDSQRKQAEETERLWKKGIVPAAEFESSRERAHSLQLDLTSAEEEMAAVLAKGSPQSVALAAMDKANAEAKVARIAAELARAQVRAPVAGLAMKPVASSSRTGGGEGKSLAVGASVQADEALLAIGDLTGVSIAVKVDEVDVTRLRVGMRTRVTLDAFPGVALEGRIKTLSPHAEEYGGGTTSFTATIEVTSIPDDLRPRLLMGMSANAEIMLREPQPVLQVPLSAVQSRGAKRYVFVGGDSSGAGAQPREVVTGQTTADSVEILSGLQEGESVQTVAAGR